MDAATAAAAEAAKRKVKRADGLLRDAVRELAALAEGQDTLGVLRAHDAASRADAQELIDLGVARHGAVDVVVIARPIGRNAAPPPQRNGAKETQHGASQTTRST